MFLSGKGGSGKSYTIFTIERYYHYFCQSVSISFENNSIFLTAMTGLAAELIKGITLHSATAIENKKFKINDEKRDAWTKVRMLVIDEISFCRQSIL